MFHANDKGMNMSIIFLISHLTGLHKISLPDLHFLFNESASYYTKDLSTMTAVMQLTGELQTYLIKPH